MFNENCSYSVTDIFHTSHYWHILQYSNGFSIFHHQEALAQNSGTVARPVSSFLTYHNSTYGVIVQYPSDWIYKGSENMSNANNGAQVQPIVTFAPQDKNIHALVTVGTVNLLSVFKSIRIENTSSFASLVIDSIRKSTLGFQLVESSTTTVKTGPTTTTAAVAGSHSLSNNSAATTSIPAHKIVYTAAGPVHNTMAVYAIKGDKAFFISYLTETQSIYSSYLQIAQKMMDSFRLVDARTTTTLTAAGSSSATQTNPNSNNTKVKLPTTTLTPPASSFTTSSNTAPSNASSHKRIAELKAAREQLLLAWNHTSFQDQFDTFVNSAY